MRSSPYIIKWHVYWHEQFMLCHYIHFILLPRPSFPCVTSISLSLQYSLLGYPPTTTCPQVLIILAASQYSYIEGGSNSLCFMMKLLIQHDGLYILWPSTMQTHLWSNGLYYLFLHYIQILYVHVLVSRSYSVAFSLSQTD